MVIFTPKMAENIFEIIFILMAAKNHTSNFADRPFGHCYYSSSIASLTAPCNLHYYSTEILHPVLPYTVTFEKL